MFSPRFFPVRFFGPRFWPPGAEAAVVSPKLSPFIFRPVEIDLPDAPIEIIPVFPPPAEIPVPVEQVFFEESRIFQAIETEPASITVFEGRPIPKPSRSRVFKPEEQ